TVHAPGPVCGLLVVAAVGVPLPVLLPDAQRACEVALHVTHAGEPHEGEPGLAGVRIDVDDAAVELPCAVQVVVVVGEVGDEVDRLGRRPLPGEALCGTQQRGPARIGAALAVLRAAGDEHRFRADAGVGRI